MPEAPSDRAEPTTGASNEEDLALIERVAAGDRRAFEALYHKHYHALLRFISRMTGEPESAEEGVNDVMLVVWDSSSKFGRRSKVTTWLMGIAYRKALRILEKKRRWFERFKSRPQPESIEPPHAEAGHTDTHELEDWLEHGMRRLSAKQRAVVELTYYYGHSYEEIAAIVDCPVNTVKTRMLHARAKLRQSLPMLESPGSKR